MSLYRHTSPLRHIRTSGTCPCTVIPLHYDIFGPVGCVLVPSYLSITTYSDQWDVSLYRHTSPLRHIRTSGACPCTVIPLHYDIFGPVGHVLVPSYLSITTYSDQWGMSLYRHTSPLRHIRTSGACPCTVKPFHYDLQ